jgi:quinol monooxygenase YgiN
MMFTVLAELKVREGKVDEAKAAFRELVRAVKSSEPGTLEYTFLQRKDDPLTFIVFERYQDENAFQTHMVNLQQHAAAFASVLAGAPSATFLDEV